MAEGNDVADGARLTLGDSALIEVVQDPRYGDLWTGPVPAIRGTGFPPLKEIHVEVSCRDGKGRHWRSSNEYLVSAEGVFDTTRTAAVGEGYYGIAPEGPFYSMLCQEPDTLGDPGRLDGPAGQAGLGRHDFAWRELSSIDYRVACFEGKTEIFSQNLRRDIGRPAQAPLARVFLFDDGGSSEHAIQALQSHGVEVATLDPRQATDSDLPAVIVGCGRASARALEIAIRWPQAQAVALFSGGGLRFDPFEDEEGPLDHIELDHASLRPKAEGILVTRTMYAEAVASKGNRERGRIEVEKIACPVYMFSGLDDQIWPASAFSELIAQRRKIKGCPFPTYHRTFEGVGHDLGPTLGPPTLPTTERTIAHPDTGFRLLLGGKPGRQARARRECWDALIAILNGNPPSA